LDLSTANGTIEATGRVPSVWLAEAGTCQLEYLTLASLTNDPKYAEVVLRFYRYFWNLHPNETLVNCNLPIKQFPIIHVGSGGDSYYEYLIKTYVLTGGISPKLLARHNQLVEEIRAKILFRSVHQNLAGIGRRNSSSLIPVMEHLAMFIPGVLVLGTVNGNHHVESDLKLAEDLVNTFSKIQARWDSGLVSDKIRFNIDDLSDPEDFEVVIDEYWLRPEAIESIYVLWKFTGEEKYRDLAWRFFEGIEKSCKLKNGYATRVNVTRKEAGHKDIMESWFLAETLKYLYLIFSDSKFLSPTEWVLNTEAHPLRIMSAGEASLLADLLKFS